MSERRAFAAGATTNLAANLLGALLSALSIVVTIRSLEVVDWGTSAALLGVGQFLGSLMSFGTPTMRIRDYSRLSPPEAAVRGGGEGYSRLIVGVGVVAIGSGLAVPLPLVGVVVILAGGVFVSLGATNVLIAQRRYVAAGILLTMEKTLSLTIVSLLALNGGIVSATLPLSVAIAGISAGVLSQAMLGARGRALRDGAKLSNIASQWRGSSYFGLASVSPSVLLMDVAVVGSVAGGIVAGQYAVGSRLVAPLSVAATTITAVVLPHLSTRKPARFHFRMGAKSSVVLGALAALFLAGVWVAPLLLEAVLGSEYRDAAGAVRFFILNAGIVLLTRTGVSVLQAWGFERSAGLLVAGQVALCMVGLVPGAIVAGPTGAAASVFFTNAFLAIALWIAIRAAIRDEDGRHPAV
ncbi:lipopolysaccharide biosynthesis protein [Leifsonia flava]|uniref:Polysaccharide biosynthesis protein n=1 Tax=Orlajensenia leifsoniae TaxID=2561933 RepID=A0A4Y9QWW0_9MICO|nr:hypothetical protein [Leifsonia flava]TFV96961.1 hypothetical protein E4M00_12960 [Leifsonia flava]